MCRDSGVINLIGNISSPERQCPNAADHLSDVGGWSTITLPPFITQQIFRMTTPMSCNGSPSSATMSAKYPGATDPRLFSLPSNAAPGGGRGERLLGCHASLHKPLQFAGIWAEHRKHGVRTHGETHARLAGAPGGLEVSARDLR